MFIGALKSAFVRAFECAYCFNVRRETAYIRETAFFVIAALRGTCEELIVLKFLSQLSFDLRDEVMKILVGESLRKALKAQQKFFEMERPFQPVLRTETDAAKASSRQTRLTEIGISSGLWSTKGKLPPVDQMAHRLGIGPLYEYFYRTTSEVVHFNPRISLRHGWGETATKVTFSTNNFNRYYLNYGHTYSVFLFIEFYKNFRDELAFTKHFESIMKDLAQNLEDEDRWPEAVTYEEMNYPEPGALFRTLLRIKHGKHANQ